MFETQLFCLWLASKDGSKILGIVVIQVLACGDGPLTEDEKSPIFPTS